MSDTRNYDTYNIRRIRWRNSGAVMMPVAAPDYQPAQLVQLHSTIEYEAVMFTVTAIGDYPVIPTYTDLLSDSNYKFLYLQFDGQFQQMMADGTLKYGVAGTYYYGLTESKGLDNGFPLGTPPYAQPLYPTASENIPAANFQGGILNTSVQTPAPPLASLPDWNPQQNLQQQQQYYYGIKGNQQ